MEKKLFKKVDSQGKMNELGKNEEMSKLQNQKKKIISEFARLSKQESENKNLEKKQQKIEKQPYPIHEFKKELHKKPVESSKDKSNKPNLHNQSKELNPSPKTPHKEERMLRPKVPLGEIPKHENKENKIKEVIQKLKDERDKLREEREDLKKDVEKINKEKDELVKENDELKKLVLSVKLAGNKIEKEKEEMQKRLENEIEETKRYGAKDFIQNILPTIDTFQTSLNVQEISDEMKNWLVGFKMIYRNLMNTLKDEGVKKIETKPGDDFDYKIHHAIEEVETNEVKAGKIVELKQDGFMLKDKLLRPAMVTVAKKSKKPKQNSEDKKTSK